jgi:protein-S-isoprenylcysteine O-methyltransferase Ste14
LIPFLFVLAIVFGLLDIIKIFGKNRAVNFLIAFSIAFFSITNSDFVNLLWSQFGNITSFFIVMFFIAFVLEVVGFKGKKGKGGEEEDIIIYGAILLLLLSFGFAYSSLIPTMPYLGGGSNFIVLIAIILILVIFWRAFKIGAEPTIPGREEHKRV